MLVLAVERLASARSTDDVIATLRDSARNLVGADGICVVLRDDNKCFYVEEDAIGPLWKGGRFPMETCISGWAMLNRKTAVIPDVFVDDRIPHAVYSQTFVNSLVMTPIGHDQPTAALGAYWARNYQAPREVVDTLETLARAAATALDNVYLFSALSSSLKKMELARDDLSHRLSNALTAIDTFGRARLATFDATELSQHVQALSRAHELASGALYSNTVSLGALVAAELAPYRQRAGAKVDLSGPDLQVSGAQALALALVLNDLALQAMQSDALKSADQSLAVQWRDNGRSIALEWRQAFASAEAASSAGNLASALVRSLVSSQLGGTMRQVMNGAAISVMIDLPVTTDVVFPANKT